MAEPTEVAEPDDAGCGDDTARPYDLIDPGDEPPHEDIEVAAVGED